MYNLQNTCQAGSYDEGLIATNFETLRLQLRALERSPFIDPELDPGGQYAKPSKHLSGSIL